MYRPTAVFVGALLLVVTGLAGCGQVSGTPAVPSTPPPAEQRPEPLPEPEPPPPSTVRLVVVGDIMLDREPGEAIARGADPFAGVSGVLQEADLAVGNLECVIATVGQKVPKAYNFRCHPRNVAYLARYFAGLSLANNHSGDYGKDALVEQFGLLKAGGVGYFGGGMDAAEAHAPLVLERNGIRVALLGYNEVELRSYEAGPATPGLAWSVDEKVVADIAAARTKADLVIVYPHWGYEYQGQPSERQQQLARLMIDAGADLVVGGHPHVTQTVEYYRDRLIVYSLGNFVFDDFNDVPPALNEPSRTSWMLRVTLDKTGLVAWDTVVARTDDSGFPQVVGGVQSPCGKAESKEIAACTAE
ncbi:MAG: putative poly-gamma-glutamate biosynthesis enzyme [Symbiobacteriaceae bacterium]|nr:putative poly-gamma-glutamate biosynthesis enzyme [Symbiobacteriaceae bacterium]